jgi:FAD/FMN-containing dehydrogenase
MALTRRTIVRCALGAAAGTLLGSCRPTPAAGPQSPSAPGPTSPPAPPAPQDLGALAKTIDGQVILPSSTEYTTAKRLFNARFNDSTPAAVVAAKSTADVQRAVAFAAKNRLKVAARSGGHSYIGASAANGALVIDLRQLPGGISYDEGRGLATVPAGAELDSVQTALAAHGRSIPAGSCPTVGVAGLTLGGGLGSDARKSGLTCDALVSASVVLPSGKAVTAAADDHDDLFWGLRGGGGGNFGVVTSFTFRTFPTGDRDIVNLTFPEAAAGQVIPGWHGWLHASDRAVWGMVNISVGSGSSRLAIVLATPGGAGTRIAESLSAAIGLRPLENTSQTYGHLDFVNYFAGGAQATRPRAFVAGSDIIGDLTSAAAESVVAALSAWPADAGSASAVLESLDGAINDVDPGGSAFPWRRHAACVQWYSEPPTPAAVDSATNWLARAHEAVRANSVGGYVNYVEPNTSAARYLGDNLSRLNAIRQQYDPSQVMASSITY